MAENLIFLEPCPESVWALLPGGPTALDERSGEAWQYMGTVTDGGRFCHQFRHRAHPGCGGRRVVAEVVDGDMGPGLGALLVAGGSLPLPAFAGGTS